MLIGGLQKFSLLDYSGKVSAIVFTQGCNFRCRFCYNPMLVWPAYAKASATTPNNLGESNFEAAPGEGSKSKYTRPKGERQKFHPIINLDDFFVFLKSRIGKLDAVVVTGGEPTLHDDLPEFIGRIKALGFLVKLDTNGSRPDVLAKLTSPQPSPSKGEGVRLVDYVAMDLKAPEKKYRRVTGVLGRSASVFPKTKLFDAVKKSVKIIMASGLPYEFRTTVVPELLDLEDITEMGKIIRGADQWYLQNFKSQTELVCPRFMGKVPYNLRQMQAMAAIGRQYVKRCEVR